LQQESPDKENQQINCNRAPNEPVKEAKMVTLHPLETLPSELLFIIFDKLNSYELGLLTLVSKHLRNQIYQYVIESPLGHVRLCSAECFDEKKHFKYDAYPSSADVLSKFKMIGSFLKRLTILDSTDNRVKLFCDFERKLFLHIDFRQCTSDDYQQFKFRFRCFGAMVQTFVLGWDESETKRMIQCLERVFGLNFLVKKFMRFENGKNRLLEYYIRYFYRMIFFDSQKFIADKAYWIDYVVNQYSQSTHHLLKMIERSKLLILFFGPLIGHQGDVSSVGWDSIHIALFIDEELSALGNVIEILSELPSYTNSNICLLIHALVHSPISWRVENRASLLYHSGIAVTQQYFKYILKKDDINDVSQMLIYFSIISSRKSKCHFFQVLDYLYKEDRNFFGNLKYLLRELSESFFRLALNKEAADFNDEDDYTDDEIDIYDIVKTLTEIMDILLLKSYPTVSTL
jgi:hypothetical protein